MNMMLRVIFVAMATVALALLVWIVTPSSMFYSPVSLNLEGDRLTFVRDTPFGEVQIEWIGEITLLKQDHYECGGSGRRLAQPEPGGVMSATIGAWAKPCLDAGAPFILRFQYQVMLFGIIPLRPTGITLQVDAEDIVAGTTP